MSIEKILYPVARKNCEEDNDSKYVIEERALLRRINCLPVEIQQLVANFSTVVADQRILVRYQFFNNWVRKNTNRIMSLLDDWPKSHIGFVLTSIIQFEEPDFDGYLENNIWYNLCSVGYMRNLIQIYIGHRTKIVNQNIFQELMCHDRYTFHKFVPCRVNPEFDKCPPIRVYGAYKAIEEYDTRLKLKLNKKLKK